MKKQDLIARNQELEKENTLWLCATNDLINDKVKWFRRGKYSLGICRPNGASGGIVLSRFKDGDNDLTTVHNWEEFYHNIEQNVPAPTNKEAIEFRNLAMDAMLWTRKMQNL